MKNSQKTFRHRTARSAAILCAVGLIIWQVRHQSLTPAPAQAQFIPPTGIALNETKGRVPGNPDNAVNDLKRIYQLINVYRGRHSGAYPSKWQDILQDLHNLKAYGLKNIQDLMDTMTNPDSKYSDTPADRRSWNRTCVYSLSDRRYNGQKIGDPKPPGLKDVLASTSIYYHQNARTFPGERSTVNPVGFYVVLYDDGIIKEVPYDEIRFVPRGGSDYHYAFPEQAGIPPTSLTYDEFWRLTGWKRGPRGGLGASGKNYKGKQLP